MKKPRKYFAVIVPLFAAYVIQIGVCLIGALVYFFLSMIMVIYVRWEAITDGKFSINMTIDQVINIITSQKFIELLDVMATIVSIVLFYLWFKNIRRNNQKDTAMNLAAIFNVKIISLLFLFGLGYELLETGILNLTVQYYADIYQDYSNLVTDFLDGNQIIILINLLLLAPILEELIFRGIIFMKACDIFPFIVANICQAAFFSLYHLNIFQGICAFIPGLLLGYITYLYKSIVASIVLHSFFNFFAYFMVIIYPSRVTYIIYSITGLALFIIIFKIINKGAIKE